MLKKDKKAMQEVKNVQKRLGQIVYVQTKGDEMISRQGRSLEQFRD